jgi:hypothetical protein
MEPFASEDGFLQAVKVSRRFELQPAPGATVLISTASGRPLLVKGVHGKGRVAIFGSTLDRDWNDWPIRSSYLPAVRALTASLGGSSQGLKVVDISLGEKRTVPVSYCPVWIQTGAYIAQGSVSPGRKAVDSCSQGKNGFEATFASPEVPGLYELRTDSGKVADVVVRTPPLESDLSKIPRVDIETALGISKKSAIGSMMGLPGEGQEGASPTAWLLLLAVLILGMEQWLTRRG